MRQSFPLTSLTWQQFEDLVILICRHELGVGAKTFSTGKDGGRDSYFEGTANYFPSKAEPWNGKFVIQAKHTEIENASCSDPEFYSVDGKTCIISKEIVRLLKLKSEDSFDNYIIFTNRKLSAGANANINKRLRKDLGIEHTFVCGLEEIKKVLKQYPDIVRSCGLDKYDLPFRFYENDIQKIITVFERERENIILNDIEASLDFSNIEKVEKNRLNNLSETYFDIIKEDSLLYFKQIETFLKDNKNKLYTKYYENTVRELKAKIETYRDEFTKFEKIIEYLVDYITDRANDELIDCRSLIRVFLHFMYFNCDIGRDR